MYLRTYVRTYVQGQSVRALEGRHPHYPHSQAEAAAGGVLFRGGGQGIQQLGGEVLRHGYRQGLEEGQRLLSESRRRRGVDGVVVVGEEG